MILIRFPFQLFWKICVGSMLDFLLLLSSTCIATIGLQSFNCTHVVFIWQQYNFCNKTYPLFRKGTMWWWRLPQIPPLSITRSFLDFQQQFLGTFSLLTESKKFFHFTLWIVVKYFPILLQDIDRYLYQQFVHPKSKDRVSSGMADVQSNEQR